MDRMNTVASFFEHPDLLPRKPRNTVRRPPAWAAAAPHAPDGSCSTQRDEDAIASDLEVAEALLGLDRDSSGLGAGTKRQRSDDSSTAPLSKAPRIEPAGAPAHNSSMMPSACKQCVGQLPRASMRLTYSAAVLLTPGALLTHVSPVTPASSLTWLCEQLHEAFVPQHGPPREVQLEGLAESLKVAPQQLYLVATVLEALQVRMVFMRPKSGVCMLHGGLWGLACAAVGLVKCAHCHQLVSPAWRVLHFRGKDFGYQHAHVISTLCCTHATLTNTGLDGE